MIFFPFAPGNNLSFFSPRFSGFAKGQLTFSSDSCGAEISPMGSLRHSELSNAI
jgi:hypothetical protein